MQEAYCTQCNVYLFIINNTFRLVCPSCVMFHGHKLHVVIPPEEAVKNLRDLFDKNIKSGKLKIENTENVLVDVR